jgi:2,5-diketo-D-gluconate reductase A
MTVASIPLVDLSHGGPMPQLGLGTWPMDDDEAEGAVLAAFEVGYRHIDTAVKYGNETGIGRALALGGLDRDELFVTTKLDGTYQGNDRAVDGLQGSLQRLGLDYVDLLLIHWPLPARGEFVSTWQTFERLLADGLTRAIGVSNFTPAHLATLAAETSVVPAVNQVQLSPFTPRQAEREYAAAHDMVIQSYSPIGAGRELLHADPVQELAGKHHRTPAQIVLRWHVQQGLVPVPKSADPTRMATNSQVFDFELDEDDMADLATLDRGPAAGIDSDVEGH